VSCRVASCLVLPCCLVRSLSTNLRRLIYIIPLYVLLVPLYVLLVSLYIIPLYNSVTCFVGSVICFVGFDIYNSVI
jgi:hypothetical protein